MTDYSRDRLGPDDEDRLPWLEPVEEEVEEVNRSGRFILVAVIALLVLGVIVGGFLWMRGSDGAGSGNGELIEAPDSYYKERPEQTAPASADDEIVYSASKGNEVESVIDTSGTAETPVNIDRPRSAEPPLPAPAASPVKNPPAGLAKAPAAKPAAPAAEQPVARAPAKPKPAAVKTVTTAEPATGGSTIQIGAFSSQAKANAAWKNLSGRFSFLAGLTHMVVPVEADGKTLYRLRASGGNAGDICGRLRTAGESCTVIG